MSDDVKTEWQSLKRVWALAGPHRKALAWAIALRFVQSMFLGLGFAGVLWVITDMMAGRPMDAAWAWQITGLMAVSLLGQMLFSFLTLSRAWIAAYLAGGRIRQALLERVRALPLGFHLGRHRGDTITTFTSDAMAVEGFFSDGLTRVVQGLGLPVVILAFVALRDLMLAATMALTIVIALPILAWVGRYMAHLGAKRGDLQAAAAGRIIEYTKGLQVIRAFNQTARGNLMFDRAVDDFHDISVRLVVSLVFPMVGFVALLMTGVALTTLSLGWRWGDLPADLVVTALVLSFALYGPVVGYVTLMEKLRIADAALMRMDRILLAKPQTMSSEPAPMSGTDLRFDAVDFAYDADHPVLHGVSFDAPARSMTAIVGPSGSGKSTILNLIARFWDPQNGQITLGGADLRDLTAAQLSASVSMVFQDVYLFAGSIRDNIALGRPDATEADIIAAAKDAQAHDFIMALPDGYDTDAGEGGTRLSGGERQRISIARAILKDAPIVLLDEATAAIDPTNERLLQTALSRLVADRTLIVVAHKLTTIQAADQILVLDQGQIAQRGSHEDLLTQGGLYAQLWAHKTQADGWTIA